MDHNRQDAQWADEVLPVVVPASLAGELVASGRYRLFGYNANNTGTGTLDFQIHDSTDASGIVPLHIQVPASSSQTVWFAGRGLLFERGIFASAPGITAAVVLYLQPASLIGSGRRRDYQRAEVELIIGGPGDPDTHRHSAGGHAGDVAAYG